MNTSPVRKHARPARIHPGGVIRAALLGCIVPLAAQALDEIAVSIERIEDPAFSADGIEVVIDAMRESAHVSISQLDLRALPQPVRNVRIACEHFELSNQVIACTKSKVVADWPKLGHRALDASVRYTRDDGSLDISISGLELAGGLVSVEGSLRERSWRADVRLQRAPVEELTRLVEGFGISLPPLSASGRVDLTASLRGRDQLEQIRTEASIDLLTASSEAGNIASENLAFDFEAQVERHGAEWQVSLHIESEKGQAYVQPVYLDLGAHPLVLDASARVHSLRRISLERFALRHAGIATATGSAQLDLDDEQPLRVLDLTLDSMEFPGAYASYLQPFLLETALRSSSSTGRLAGSLAIEAGEPQRVDLRFEDVSLADRDGKFAMTGVSGEWHWRSQSVQSEEPDDDADDALPAVGLADAEPSSLSWQGGTMLGLDIGAAKIEFASSGRQARLLAPTRIPLLDGALQLDRLRLRNAGLPNVAFLIDATLQPVSVARLSRAFGWPEFGGRLSGAVSRLRMRDGLLTLGTTLRAQVFDGTVTLSGLALEQPFGPWPRLSVDVGLENLDLELVTSAFAFGRITGRLSGAIDDLNLFNWTPVAFDARLYTPPGDRSRHRISQRAVENIGSLGGGSAGVTAALSSGFLGFFDDFNYDRLGISCRLENEVCIMGGVAPAPGGYYLVKGSGLPRIDVIGSGRRVDWPRLVRQLIAVTESEGPVIN